VLKNVPLPFLVLLALFFGVTTVSAFVQDQPMQIAVIVFWAFVAWRALSGSRIAAYVMGVMLWIGVAASIYYAFSAFDEEPGVATVSILWGALDGSLAAYLFFDARLRSLYARTDKSKWHRTS